MRKKSIKVDPLGSSWKIGDIRNGYPVLKKEDRETILLLSDDLRMFSGVATMSKELVLGTIHHFNWIQIAGSIKHPEFGKIIDMSKSIQKETGIEDAQLKLYPMNGYGNPDILRQILSMEKDINAIMHFTDPRQWLWLVSMENELRQNIPLVYYALWDDLPYPMYNQGHYRSCDLIMGISKQSNNLHKNVLGPYSNKTKTTYVPHGINSEVFKPVLDIDPKFEEFRKKLLGDKKYDKIFLYNNRNIRRKMPGDLINSYKQFCDTLTKEEADRCLLIFHTRPVDNSGTDIPAVHQALCPEYNIMYSTQKVSAQELNYLYNVVDVTLGISSAEGFGLATAESLMAGTPILVNVTGGLQDQCGFVDSEGKLIEYSSDFPSNSCGRYADAAEWAFQVFPQMNLVGSPPTPYIYDSRANVEDIVIQMKNIWELTRDNLKNKGLKGREFMINNLSSEIMCNGIIRDISECIKNFKPQKRFDIYKAKQKVIDPNICKGIWNESESKWV